MAYQAGNTEALLLLAETNKRLGNNSMGMREKKEREQYYQEAEQQYKEAEEKKCNMQRQKEHFLYYKVL